LNALSILLYNALIDRRGKHKDADELTESEKLSAQLSII